MKRNIILIICLLCFGQMLMAQKSLKSFKDNNGLYGLKDKKNGNVVVEPKYSELIGMGDGLYKIMIEKDNDKKYGILNTYTGEEMIPCLYHDEIYYEYRIIDGKLHILFFYTTENSKIKLFNNAGRELSSFIYDSIGFMKHIPGLAIAKIGDMKGIVDSAGTEIVPFKYKDIDEDECKKDVYRVRKPNGKWTYQYYGKEINIDKYNNAGYIDESGFLRVSIGKQSGFLNKEGKEIVTCKYDDYTPYEYVIDNKQQYKVIRYFNPKGVMKVYIGKKFGYIDTLGNEVVPVGKYGSDEPNVGYGAIIMKSKGKYGIIDFKGNQIVPYKFDYFNFNSDFSKVQDKSGKSALDYAGMVSPDAKNLLLIAHQKYEDDELVRRAEVEKSKIEREKNRINEGFDFLFEYQCNGTNRFAFLQGRKVSVYRGTMTLTNTYEGKAQSTVLRLRIASTKENISNGVKYWTYNFYENENNYKSAIVEFNTGNFSKEMYSITLVSDAGKDPIYCNDIKTAAGIK